jgi:excisionase family DNA binding protein
MIATMKPFYTLPELAKLLGMSRWTARRWLEANRIPYELRRRPGSKRGGRIVVWSSEIRAVTPRHYATLREEQRIVYGDDR